MAAIQASYLRKIQKEIFSLKAERMESALELCCKTRAAASKTSTNQLQVTGKGSGQMGNTSKAQENNASEQS